jgi:hypothetical protein
LASAVSVPGVGCRCSVASCAVADRRGSTTIRAPPRALRLEVAHEGRHRLGRVAAGEQDGVGALEILERERQAAVEAEGAQRRRRARRHAVAAVVVDVGGADGHPRELAEEIRLLVGQRAAAEDADGILAVRAHGVADAEGDAVERVAPADRHEPAGAIARQRLTQPLGVVDDGSRVPALRAQRAGVDREGAVADHRQRRRRARDDAALQRAVRAMRLDGVGGRCGHDRPIPVQDARPSRVPPRRSDKALILLAKSLSRGGRPGGGVVATGERECSPQREVLTEMSRFGRSRAFLAVAAMGRRTAPGRRRRFGLSKNVCSPAKWEHYCPGDHTKLNWMVGPTHVRVQTFMWTLQVIWTFTSP